MTTLQTTRTWHDNHYEHTTPDSHYGRWRQFIEIDPFNPENRMEGHIQMQGGDEYGASGGGLHRLDPAQGGHRI